ncbi:telomere repeat-binding factor 4-like, partial [Trifolium medium]|nr:telomere repeat-binding factor 4-like [Trifolium medium]
DKWRNIAINDPCQNKQAVNTPPRYNAMVFEALSTLKDTNGSDLNAIASFIEQKHQVPQNFRRTLSSRLRTLVNQEKLEKIGPVQPRDIGNWLCYCKDLGWGIFLYVEVLCSRLPSSLSNVSISKTTATAITSIVKTISLLKFMFLPVLSLGRPSHRDSALSN